MNISRFAVSHRTTVFVLMMLIVLAGWMSYTSLPRESAPDIKIPYIMVMTSYESVAPSDIESLITRPIERKLKTVTEIKELRSTSSEGMSVITAEFEPDYDLDTALQKVRDKVDEAQQDLPDDLENDPTVKEISASEMFPVMFVMISGDVGLVKLKDIAEDVEEDIESVSGVLAAEIVGGLEREIRVEFDQDRVAAYGLTMAEIITTVSRNNVTTPGGSIDIGDAKYSLKSPGEFVSPAEIDHLIVAVRDKKPIYLSDIAQVRDTFKDPESFSRIDGKEAIGIRVTKRPGANLLKIADKIKVIVDGYRKRLPDQVVFTTTSDSSTEITMMIEDLENNMVSGLVLVLAVVFVSLGFRNAIMVASAIPLSMLITFFVLQAMGITLNMVVLFSLILALGMLVDNAIVIMDNIYRHHVDENKPLIQATIDAMDELAWPVVSSTATNAIVFVPLLFWPGVMGQFMSYLPLTVIIALCSSLFVAMVINPTLGSIFTKRSRRDAKRKPGQEDQFGAIVRTYRKMLEAAMKHRFASIFFFFGLLVALIYMFAHSGLGMEVFPDSEPRRITVSIAAPEGTNIYRTDEFARKAEAVIQKYGNIRYVTTAVGAGGETSGPHLANIIIDLVDREDRRDGKENGKILVGNSNEMMTHLRKELAGVIVGADVKVDKEAMGPPMGKPINVEIAGDDYQALANIAEDLKKRIKDTPGVVDLTDDYQAGLPELRIEVDKEKAALLGLNTALVGQTVKAAVNGLKVGDYREGEDEFDIIARLPENQRETLEDVMRIRIPDLTGQQIPLTSVANVVSSSGLSAIKHIDQKRIITVSSNVAAGYNTNELLKQVQKSAEQMNLPMGYEFRYTGENEEMEESKGFIGQAFLIANLAIYLILVTEFNSVVMPAIIMVSIVLSLIGVFLGLLLGQQPFGVIMTGMGVVSLAGVVVNNAIVLIDYTNVLRQRGHGVHEAIVRAGCVRFRAVILGAITTALGLIPTAFGLSFDFREMRFIVGSESSQWWGPMASVVFYGLIIATVLTLFVIPNVYSLLFDFHNKSREEAMAKEETGEPESEEEPVMAK